MSFTVAIVGRPNVGKSTLFNRLVGRRVALVDDRPGVTRDRREGEAKLGDLAFTAVDTAGLEEATAESLSGRMVAQTRMAIDAADAVLFLVDARTGLTPSDRFFADLVRRSGKPTILVANKSEAWAIAGALEGYALGLGEPVPLSAEHGEGLADLYAALRAALPEQTASPPALVPEARRQDEDVRSSRPIQIAVVGRPNSGKSTLINKLVGEERLLTGPEAGITRDSVAVGATFEGRSFRIFDTAGIRRRPRIAEPLEKLSVADALRAVRFAEVVVLLLDAQHPFEEQDLRLADLVEREGRALVLAIGKWDLIDGRSGVLAKLTDEAAYRLPQLKGVPVIAVSGRTGEGLEQLMREVVEVHATWNRRLPTHALNRWLADTVAAHPPPAVGGRRIRVNYVTQPKTRPPSFVMFTTRADAVPEAYRRYLINDLREVFDLKGVPIRLTVREKENPYARRR